MSYRRDSEKQRTWHKWLERHRDVLIESRLPEFVYADEMTWLRFVEHGGWHHELGWSVNILSAHEAAILSDFIISEYGSVEYRYLLQSLDGALRKSAGSLDRSD